MYGEEALRNSYLNHKQSLSDLFGDKVEAPTIEEFRIQYEEEVVQEYWAQQDEADEEDN